MYCHAGCDTKDILTEIGLTYSDIDTNITPKDVRPEWQGYIETITNSSVQAVYNYTDEQGEYLYSNIRLINSEGKKTFRQGIIRKDKINLGLANTEKTLYNLSTILKTIREHKNQFPIFIVEGEKDVETMKRLGLFNATTAGGAKGWSENYAKYFIGADVVILPDNDAAGQELVKTIIKSIDKLDSVNRYLRLYCIITEDDKDKIQKTELEDKYTAFMLNSGNQPVNKKNLKERLIKNGVMFKKSYHGYPCYARIKSRETYLIEIEGLDPLYLPIRFEK